MAFFYFQKEFHNISNHGFMVKTVILYLFELLYPLPKICHKLTNQKKILIFLFGKASVASVPHTWQMWVGAKTGSSVTISIRFIDYNPLSTLGEGLCRCDLRLCLHLCPGQYFKSS